MGREDTGWMLRGGGIGNYRTGRLLRGSQSSLYRSHFTDDLFVHPSLSDLLASHPEGQVCYRPTR